MPDKEPIEKDLVADKFDPIRKGLLEFAVLHVISGKKVYAADILAILMATEFQTQEGTLYPLLSRLRREGAVPRESTTALRTKGKSNSRHCADIGKNFRRH